MINRITVPAPATLRHLLSLSLLALLGSLVSVAPLHAGVLFTFDQVGSNVVATTSGSIASGWGGINSAATQTYTSDRGVLSNDTIRAEVNGGKRYYNTAGGWTMNTTMAGVFLDTSGVVTGDAFGYSGNQSLIVPAAVNPGDAFTPSTTITWSNATYESLGLDTGLSTSPLVLFTLDNNETISAVRGEPVPEPTSIAFLATGGLAVGVVTAARRRRRTGARS